jgi:hypothetical protein
LQSVHSFVVDQKPPIGPNLPAYADSEGSIFPVTPFNDRHLASKEAAWSIEYLMCMAMVSRCVM